MRKSKECTKCKQTKKLTEYYKDKKRPDGIMSHCKECQKVYSRNWTKKNMDKHGVYCENYYSTHKEQYTISRLKHYYKQRDKALVIVSKFMNDEVTASELIISRGVRETYLVKYNVPKKYWF